MRERRVRHVAVDVLETFSSIRVDAERLGDPVEALFPYVTEQGVDCRRVRIRRTKDRGADTRDRTGIGDASVEHDLVLHEQSIALFSGRLAQLDLGPRSHLTGGAESA